MELHNLKPPEGSKKSRRRVGRGPGSGRGKTSGRGHKGEGQHASRGKRRGHEGGQMPLARRVPKRGFTNVFKKEVLIVNLVDLNRLDAGEVNTEILLKAGLIKKTGVPIKILGNGNVDKAYNVKATAFSKAAVEKIEAAGGKTEVV